MKGRIDNDKPLVTICCITYNHERHVSKALDSFLMQRTDFNFEILISDDCSTDNTINIIKEYAKKHPSIVKTIFAKVNQYSQGVEPLSTLLAKATGKYVAICEGDDYWTNPDKLAKQVQVFEKNKNVTICFHPARVLDLRNNKTTVACKHYDKNRTVPTESVITGSGAFMPTASIMAKNTDFGVYSKVLQGAPVGDYFFMVYMASMGETYYLDEVMCDHLKFSGDSWSDKCLDASYKNNFLLSYLLAADRFLPLLKNKNHKKCYRRYWMIYMGSAIWEIKNSSEKYNYFYHILRHVKNMRKPFFLICIFYYFSRGLAAHLYRNIKNHAHKNTNV